jgi:hypothetical protein
MAGRFSWRKEQRMPPSAVGHRVVHGGPEYGNQGPKTFDNIIAERPGNGLVTEIIVIGAHYDTHKDSRTHLEFHQRLRIFVVFRHVGSGVGLGAATPIIPCR